MTESDDPTWDRDLLIPTPGGRVAATRHLPAGEGPWPVVFVYTPYHKDDLSEPTDDPLARYFVEREYAVVVADVLGTGASDGLAPSPFTDREGESGAAVVEWLAAREWTTGAVGVIGKSYPGTTALEIAAERPEGLAAIVPIHAPARPYASYFDGGALALLRTAGLWAPNFEYLATQPPARRVDGRWADVWDERLDALPDREPFLHQYLAHPTKDDYWTDRDVPVEAIEVPTLAFAGYRDPFAESTVETVDRVAGPARLVLGPWRHTVPDRGREVAIDYLGEAERWFDQFLRGADRGVLETPRIRYWTERDGGGVPDAGDWRGRESWPTADGESAAFALTPAGLADPGDDFDTLSRRWDPDWSVGADSVGFDVPGGRPLDTGPDDRRSLTVESDPLDAPFAFAGTGAVDLTVVPETTDPLLAVRLVDVAPSGDSRLVTHGVRRASLPTPIDPFGHVGGEPSPLEPGTATARSVALRPKAHVFEAGHRIRVAVSGAFFPYVLPPADAGAFTLRSSPEAPGRLRLPTGGPTESVAFEDTPAEYIPDASAPTWGTTVDHRDDRVTVSLAREYEQSLPEGTFEYAMDVAATTARDDPASTRIERTTETVLDRGTERVTTRVWNAVGRDVAHLTYAVAVNGERIVDERTRWTPTR
ncbi:MAG: CocE/NonD family hydrolase [Halobacterium sp.]